MKKAIFLDRDGIINKMVFNHKENVYDSPQSPFEVELVDGIEQIISWANKRSIPVIEVTNQPGIAKGKQNRLTLESIEKRVHNLLGEKGVKVDGVYRCLHHPLGVVPKLTRKCSCRKPKPGLLKKAAEDFKINLSKSVMIGDGAVDVEAGNAVGAKTIILLHNHDLPEKIIASQKALADYRIIALSEIIPILEKLF